MVPVAIGDKIRIIQMAGEPQYSGKEGIVKSIDSIGQIHCEEFSLAILPDVDKFIIIEPKEM